MDSIIISTLLLLLYGTTVHVIDIAIFRIDIMQQDTFFADLTFQKTLQKIAKMAVHIEHADSASSSSAKLRDKIKSGKLNNASTEKSQKSYKSIKYPSPVAGHKVNSSNEGLSPEDWEKLDSDQCTKFMDERAKIAKNQREINERWI